MCLFAFLQTVNKSIAQNIEQLLKVRLTLPDKYCTNSNKHVLSNFSNIYAVELSDFTLIPQMMNLQAMCFHVSDRSKAEMREMRPMCLQEKDWIIKT